MNVKYFVLACFLFATSCLSEKKAARIKNAAIQDYENTHPCVSDTLMFSSGSDTVSTLDTIYVENEPEILPDHSKEYLDTVSNLLSKSVKPQIKYIIKTQTIHDTINKVTRDLKFEQRYKDSLAAEQRINNDQKVKIEKLEGEKKVALAEKRNWIIYFFSLVAVLIAIVLVYLYGKIWAAKLKAIA